MSRAIPPEPNLAPSILTVIRKPDGQCIVRPMFMHRDSNGEQFLKQFLAFHDRPYAEKRILQFIMELFFMRRVVVASVAVSVTPVPAISSKSYEVHDILTSAINDPSRLKVWSYFPQTVLSPFTSSTLLSTDYTRPSTYPALMLDRTQCRKRWAIWFAMALVLSFIAGYLGGGCSSTQHCQLGTAFGVGGVVLAVLSTVQAILYHGTN